MVVMGIICTKSFYLIFNCILRWLTKNLDGLSQIYIGGKYPFSLKLDEAVGKTNLPEK